METILPDVITFHFILQSALVFHPPAATTDHLQVLFCQKILRNYGVSNGQI